MVDEWVIKALHVRVVYSRDHWLWEGSTHYGYPFHGIKIAGKWAWLYPARVFFAYYNNHPLAKGERTYNTCGVMKCVCPAHYIVKGSVSK